MCEQLKPKRLRAKKWTKRDGVKLRNLSRKIIAMDGNELRLHRMAFEVESRQWAKPPNYEFSVIARSGADGFTGFEASASINDNGEVAFTGQLNNSPTSKRKGVERG